MGSDGARISEEVADMTRNALYDITFIDMALPAVHGLEIYLPARDIDPETLVMMVDPSRRQTGDLEEEAVGGSPGTCPDSALDMEALLRLVAEIRDRKRRESGAGDGKDAVSHSPLRLTYCLARRRRAAEP